MQGIYRIQNKLNNKIYIGSSNDISRRFAEHNNKYGLDVFEFEIILLCEVFELLRYEQWFLDNIINWAIDYNIAKIAGAPMRGVPMPDNVRRKISNSLKGKAGRVHSDETKRKIGLASSKRKHSEDSKRKIKNNHADVRGELNPKAKLSIEDIINIKYLCRNKLYSQLEIGRHYDITQQHVSNIFNGKRWGNIKKTKEKKELVHEVV